MNKFDLKLILFVLVFSVLILLFYNLNNNNYAQVYYDNDLVLKINLSVDDIYKVEGYNGEVLIEVKNNKLRVYKENSPLHICSNQGWTDNGSIVCLPNKIVITFTNENLDTIVG